MSDAPITVKSGSNRSLALDGIRGIALAAPVVVHLGLADGGNGLWIAIGLFFTLSGFLITSLALKEIDRTGRISVRGFYERRLRRLMPGAILVLGVTVATARWLEWPTMGGVRRDVFAALTWTSNWESMAGAGYWESFVPSLTLHFWSLSLEEQVYLAFPIILVVAMFLLKRLRPAVRIALAMSLLTVVSWSTLFLTDNVSHLYLSTWTRMGEATLGCAVAAISHLLPTRRSNRQATWLILLMMALAAPLWVAANGDTATGIRYGILMGAPLSAGVVAMLWRYPGSLPSRFFSLRVPAWLGRRSYGIYLIHLPLIDLLQFRLHETHLRPWSMVIAVVSTIILAGLMFRIVEEPIRTARFLPGMHHFAVVIGTAAIALGLVTYGAAHDAPSGLDIPTAPSMPTTVPGDPPITLPPTTSIADGVVLQSGPIPTSPGRVLVIGDSTSWLIQGPIRDALAPLGWEEDAVFMVGCPLGGDARVKSDPTGTGVVIREIGTEKGCDEWWNTNLPLWLSNFKPDLVVLVGGYGLAFPIDPNADDHWCQLGDGSGACETWAAERLRMTSERIHTYAPQAHYVICTAGHVDPWGPMSIPHSAIDSLNELLFAEAKIDHASVIDLGPWIDDHLKYTVDGTHMGAEGLALMEPFMKVELAAVLAGERLVI